MSRILSFILGFTIFSQSLCAQNERLSTPPEQKKLKADSSPQKKSDRKTKSKASVPKRNKTVPLIGPDGKAVDVPLDVNLQEYLNWLKTRKGSDFAINAISLTGTAKEKYAELRAELTVQLLKDNDWVRVPLKLTEGVLRDSRYEGKGEASYDRYDAETGYSWWFRGKGYHKLILDLTVPVGNSNSTRRLQLTLPPRAAASSLKLKVPFQKVKTEFGTETVVETKSLDDRHTEIRSIGHGTRIDGHWSPVRDSSNLKPVFKVHSSIVAKLSLETAVLRVRQTIEPDYGQFSKVLVKMPDSFELLDVEGDAYEGHREVTGRKGWYEVRLKETTSDPVTLSWVLQSSFGRDSSTVLDFHGFEVEDAVRQRGEIALETMDGMRAMRSSREDRFVYRIRQNEFREKDFLQNSTPTETYEFLKQPFRFSRRIEEIKPYVSVVPNVSIELTPEKAILKSTFQCEIREGRGVVREIRLRWPNWQKHGWTIQSIDSQGLLEGAQASVLPNEEFHLLKFRDPQSGNFELKVHAFRELTDEDDRFDIVFPQVVASKIAPLNLDVTIADEMELNLSSTDSTKPIELFARQGQKRYRIDPGNQPLKFLFSIHEPEVIATSSCSVGIGSDRLDVTQKISHRIRYFRTSEIRFLVPESISGKLEVSLENESTPLPLKEIGGGPGGMKQVSVALPNATTGDIEFVLRYSVKISRLPSVSVASQVELPIVKSAEREFDRMSLSLQNSNRYRLVMKEDGWQQEADSSGTPIWVSSESASHVDLELSVLAVRSVQKYFVKRGFIRSSLNSDGSSFHRAQFLIAGSLTSVELNWPSEAKFVNAWWNKENVDAEHIRVHAEKNDVVIVTLPIENTFSRNKSFLLTFDYVLPSSVKGVFTESHKFVAPTFLSPVWIEQMKWMVRMPEHLHLGSSPQEYESQFSWIRNGLVWRRESRLDRSTCDLWITAERGPEDVFDSRNDRFYLFSRQGNAETLSISVLSRARAIFFGSGIALLAGFLLLRVKRMQNTLVALGGCFVFSLLGIWFSEWIQLLLQPALLGLFLASLAVGIDTVIRRRRTSVVMTVPANREVSPRYATGSSFTMAHENVDPISPTDANAQVGSTSSEHPLETSKYSSKP